MNAFKKNFGFIFVALLIAGCGGGGDDESPQVVEDIQLGNPPELALTLEEYLPGDQLFEEGHPDYYREGTPYVTAEIEAELRELVNHPAIAILRENFNDGDEFEFPEEYLGEDMLNQAMRIDSDGRKQLDEGFYFWVKVSYLGSIYGASDSPITEEERPVNIYLSPEEKRTVSDFSSRIGGLYVEEYYNINHARIKATSLTSAEALKQLEAGLEGGN